MPMKNYGIFIAYPPGVDLRDQGLGRYLAQFLKGAQELPDIRFTLVCPSWSKQALSDLFISERVRSDVFEIIAPDGKPYALGLFELLRSYRARRKRQGWLSRGAQLLRKGCENTLYYVAARAVEVHSFLSLVRFLIIFLPFLFVLLPVGVLLLPFLGIALCAQWISALRPHVGAYLRKNGWDRWFKGNSSLLEKPEEKKWVLRLFDEMLHREVSRMQSKIETLNSISAWYCPTAFWPAFNNIRAPRLMCVPDVVLSDFPVGFAGLQRGDYLAAFDAIGRAIRGGDCFVTYSEAVKWNTLVDRYGVEARKVEVIHHAPNKLNQLLEITGFPDVEATSKKYCQNLLRNAMQRSVNPAYTSTFQNGDVDFIFYASQFRPNKNILTLLRAFEYLLRKRYLKHKLVMTGTPHGMPQVRDFVMSHRLENDVIFLHGLKLPELAACYKLADLAVNPTFSEGGCPFTFTEALSVGTPVVMSRITVAEEVLTDSLLQEMTFFDPYNWQDCAARIEWAINHRDELLAVQRQTYALLEQRTWSDVVREHVHMMDKMVADTHENLPQ